MTLPLQVAVQQIADLAAQVRELEAKLAAANATIDELTRENENLKQLSSKLAAQLRAS